MRGKRAKALRRLAAVMLTQQYGGLKAQWKHSPGGRWLIRVWEAGYMGCKRSMQPTGNPGLSIPRKER
jgi:hypothetical protein